MTHALWEDSGMSDGAMMTFDDLRGQLNKHRGLAKGLAERYSIFLN